MFETNCSSSASLTVGHEPTQPSASPGNLREMQILRLQIGPRVRNSGDAQQSVWPNPPGWFHVHSSVRTSARMMICNSGSTLESLGSLKVQKLGVHPKPIKSELLKVGPWYQYFLKSSPRWLQWRSQGWIHCSRHWSPPILHSLKKIWSCFNSQEIWINESSGTFLNKVRTTWEEWKGLRESYRLHLWW